MTDKPKQLLVMLKGLPGSGKTTYARNWVTEGPNRIRVNKDDLRAMICYDRSKEKFIVEAQRDIISTALANGFSVIVDDTNFNPIHEDYLRSEQQFHNLGNHDIDLKIVVIDTPPDVCIQRDAARPEAQRVGEKVIMEMYNKQNAIYN